MATKKQETHANTFKGQDAAHAPHYSGLQSRIAPYDEYRSDFKNRSTGIYTIGILAGRDGIIQQSIRYLKFDSSDLERFSFMKWRDNKRTKEPGLKSFLIGQYKTDYPQYANIPNNRIIVMRSRPYIEFNPRNSSEPVQLPLDTKTQQTLIKEFVKTIETLKHERAITIPNIVELVRTSQYQSDDDKETPEKARIRSELKTKQTPLMAAILQHFISRPGTGSGVYPIQILSKATNMSQYGIQTVGSLISDFGEVIAPVAYITGNTTGNAGRMITEVLGATSQKLMQDATIHFNVGATERLYDSFIEYGGKVIGISSKGHADAKAEAVNTNISSLSKAINEIKSNSDALDRLRILFRKPENKRMFDIVTKIAEDRGRGSKTEKTLRLLQLLDPQYPAKEMFSDLKLLKNLQGKEGRDELERYKQPNQPRRVANQLYSQLSQYIQARMQASERKLSTSRGRENITNPWDLFLTVANDEIRNTLNSDPLFSEICTWILNHSNTVQIDVYSQNPVSEGRRASANFGQALVVTNIVATWPSTRVDRIELQDVKGESIQFKLLVNGYAKAYPDRAYKPFKSMDFRDVVDPGADDRVDSTNYTAQDWLNRGVNGPRTSVDVPGVDNTAVTATTKIAAPTVAVSSSTVQRINSFFQNKGRDMTVNQIARLCSSILGYKSAVPIDQQTFPAFITDFRKLIQDPQIAQLLQKDTSHAINLEILNEEPHIRISNENQVHVLALVFWALAVARYRAAPNSQPQFEQAKKNLNKIADGLIASGQITTQQIVNPFRSVKYTGGVTQQTSSQTQPTQQKIILSQAQVDARMNAVRSAIGSQKFAEHRDSIETEIEEGRDLQDIIEFYRVNESRSAILHGLLQ